MQTIRRSHTKLSPTLRLIMSFSHQFKSVLSICELQSYTSDDKVIDRADL